MSNVLQLRRPAPQPHTRPKPAPSGEVYIIGDEGEGFQIVDVSASGGSAGTHGEFATYADAVAEGRRVALALNRVFLEDEHGGAA